MGRAEKSTVSLGPVATYGDARWAERGAGGAEDEGSTGDSAQSGDGRSVSRQSQPVLQFGLPERSLLTATPLADSSSVAGWLRPPS